ncbi:DUF3102 domain-containing protein [Lactiplantibacillus plantarum]|jgi:uncharacterized phage infection (PIP) family protein YhgE|uniref:DUF3102 domain-containing protein n=1 Tax=Lactiplantibacillus TaxID=2767842 RepID=UPI000975E20F|nr:DUF3102 domain-containing protein [Lactiplantibacillus plantarum]MBS0940881.1 DUF3102 domain-containing protein [Lactiplantibacillus plantarum]MBU7471955.1 DUF3102 domain-containing protein [Lactiplantibacillus plantarum]MCG0690841.1 hypothetical protein [Lactiplantibacillus plantarum]MCG0942122.1 hypothetical protein [Lactiplantibacillus plantarum]MCT3224244.1 DUF3102 domain-containing protein [Lactiplantibacillus plantarum]
MERKDITQQVVETPSDQPLSTDLTQITTEIKSYQSIAGQSIFEIGRRLKWVKEHDLVHGEYINWLSSINMDDSQARKFIKVSESFPNRSTSNDLGVEALYQIATLPEEEREKLHRLESGEEKTPDEMTVRELRELKKQLKAKDDEHEAAQAALKDKYEARLQRIKAEGIREVEIPVPTVPDDYADLKQQAKILTTKNQLLEEVNAEGDRELEALRAERDQYAATSDDYQRMTEKIDQLKHQQTLLMENNELNRQFNQLVQAAIEAADRLSEVVERSDFTKIDSYDNAIMALLRLKDKMARNVQRLAAGLEQNPWGEQQA